MQVVSILIPIYKVERYISQCALSLFAQSYPHCEFIFVDDASPDRSLEMLRGVESQFPRLSSQIKIIELPENGGVAAARNTALDAATGDYIIFVDADDWVDPEIVERLMDRATATDADICNAWCVSVAANGKREYTPAKWIGDKTTHLKAVIGQSHIVTNHVRGMLFRRSLFEEHGLRFTPRVDFGEDYSLLPKALYYAKKLSTLCDYLYMYRVENEGSYMNNINERHIDNYVAAQGLVNNFIESLPNASQFDRALILGKLNIKKWIFRRGVSPRKYHTALFGDKRIPLKYPFLRLYNFALDRSMGSLIWFFGVIHNVLLYLKVKQELRRK